MVRLFAWQDQCYNPFYDIAGRMRKTNIFQQAILKDILKMAFIQFEEVNLMETIRVELMKSPVELYKILKFENIAASGGEAKHMIANGFVLVNGEVETRKRKKIFPGDQIRVDRFVLQIVSE